jgi:phosphotriesterase-related protein
MARRKFAMTEVETVRGPIDVDQLGATLMHEHLYVKNPELEQNYPSSEWDEDAMLQKGRDGLEALYDKDIHTVVDLTVLGLGRFIPRIQKLAADVRTNIVVATGYYTAKDLPAFFQARGPGRRIDMPEPLETMFLRDIQQGIADTGVKAAIIKVVTDQEGITPDVERVLRSAARAQLATGVPISTHTNVAHYTGRLQQEFFMKEGVPLERVVIGHCGDSTDLDYLKELMDNGSTIGMDRFGIDSMLPEADRIETIVALCEQGYADRLTLSHDAAFFSINTEPSHRAVLEPNWNHANVSDRVLPKLRERGVSDATIDQMMVVNPARVLARG